MILLLDICCYGLSQPLLWGQKNSRCQICSCVTVSYNSGHILGIIFHVHNIKAVLYRLLRRVTAVAKALVILKILPTCMALNHVKDNVFSPVESS